MEVYMLILILLTTLCSAFSFLHSSISSLIIFMTLPVFYIRYSSYILGTSPIPSIKSLTVTYTCHAGLAKGLTPIGVLTLLYLTRHLS